MKKNKCEIQQYWVHTITLIGQIPRYWNKEVVSYYPHISTSSYNIMVRSAIWGLVLWEINKGSYQGLMVPPVPSKSLSYSKRLKTFLQRHISIPWDGIHPLHMDVHHPVKWRIISLLTDSKTRSEMMWNCCMSPHGKKWFVNRGENKSYYSTLKSKTYWDDKHPSYWQINLRRWDVSSIWLGKVRFWDQFFP